MGERAVRWWRRVRRKMQSRRSRSNARITKRQRTDRIKCRENKSGLRGNSESGAIEWCAVLTRCRRVLGGEWRAPP